MSAEKCENCLCFYAGHDEKNGVVGICRRNPPQTANCTNSNEPYPSTRSDSWCYSWVSKLNGRPRYSDSGAYIGPLL